MVRNFSVRFGAFPIVLLSMLATAATPAQAQTTSDDTVLTPVLAGRVSTGQSYLRLFNTGTTPGQVTVKIASVADKTQILATWSVTVPANAAQQFAITDIEDAATPRLTGFTTTQYQLLISGTGTGFVQHVIFRPNDASLTVANGCGTRAVTAGRFAVDVHTNVLQGYPSTLTVQNPSATARTATFDVYDARGGSVVGTYSSVVPANGTWTFSQAKFAADTHFVARDDQYHLNFVLPTEFPGTVTHTVTNIFSGQAQNLSETCAMPNTARDGLTAPILPDNYLAYADARRALPAYYTDSAVRGSAAGTDNTPATNPITDAGATLGRVLFYDKRLSANNAVACASCHQQSHGFDDPRRFSPGFAGVLGTRHAMSLTNARFYQRGRFFWDERAATLEDQVLQPVQNTTEMGLTLEAMITKISGTDFYPALFKAAFGTANITSDRAAQALAQFVRSMVSTQSKYDTALAAGQGGIPRVLNTQEQLGFQLFAGGNAALGRTVRCDQCHQTTSLSLNNPRNNGLNLNSAADPGVGGGRFKSPSLRNIAVRGTFMHDGRFSTLAEVVEFYNSGVQANPNLDQNLRDANGNPQRLNLTQTEKDALIAFLNTLTDQAFLTDPRLSDPFAR